MLRSMLPCWACDACCIADPSNFWKEMMRTPTLTARTLENLTAQRVTENEDRQATQIMMRSVFISQTWLQNKGQQPTATLSPCRVLLDPY
jgi:hypothetical protein